MNNQLRCRRQQFKSVGWALLALAITLGIVKTIGVTLKSDSQGEFRGEIRNLHTVAKIDGANQSSKLELLNVHQCHGAKVGVVLYMPHKENHYFAAVKCN